MNYILKGVSKGGNVCLVPMRLLVCRRLSQPICNVSPCSYSKDLQIVFLPILSVLAISIDHIYQIVANLSHRDLLHFIWPEKILPFCTQTSK